MKNIKLIIFDFDGTLADCKELHQEGFRSAIASICPEAEFSDEEVEGRPTREKIRILHSKGYQFNGDKVNELKQMHTIKHLNSYIKYNSVLHTQMERLYERGTKLCIASNATHMFIDASLDILKIKHFFLKINTASDYPAKPDTTTFLDCMRFCSAGPRVTLIVEDSPVGVQCARATGAKVLVVTDAKDTLTQLKEL